MKHRYTRIFSFATALLIFAALCSCEVDDIVNFVEEPNSSVLEPNKYEYVDLGLSVKWATMNVGATTPEEYGDHFAWGETEPKDVYDWSTYKWCNGSSTTLKKYNVDSNRGTVDNKFFLESVDDVATVRWGGDWRMPTDEEMTELREQCTWTWTTQNGINGYKVTSKSNGNSIFLPASGRRYGSKFGGEGICGFYWSSSLNLFWSDDASNFFFESTSLVTFLANRSNGASVRPVYGSRSEQVDKLTVVTNITVTQITETSAVAGGIVTCEGNASVTERGVCIAATPYPTTSNTKITSGKGMGLFTCNLTGLQPNTTYYVRAYAVNSNGTAYGEEMSFTTQTQIEKPTSPYFSVSQTKYITFSPGNLQYHPANNKWRFAENQTDYIGDANGNCSSTYNGWLDLFGWSTSDTNFGVSTSTDYNDYSGSFVDWGTNTIGNDAPNTWRTLTYNEWEYVIFYRPNASSLMGVAQVNGVNGLIFLPDNWVCPEGITFKSGFHSSYGVDYYAAYQTFTADQWSKLAAAGAVFLPAAGRRFGSSLDLVQNFSDYWSATEFNSNYAYCLDFYSSKAGINIGSRYGGQSVRLVKDL